jgi:peptide/nickel transport system substrate-binding protein
VPGPPAFHTKKLGGTVVVAWPDGPNSLDPALGYNPTAWDALTQLLNSPLYQFDHQTGGPAPLAAAAMPDITDAGTTLTIKLRPGVKFHNGRAVTAADWKWSWERLLNPKLASWAVSYLASIVGASQMAAGKAKHLTGVEVVDAQTLRIHLTQPDFTVLNALSNPYMAAVPQEEIGARGSRFATTPVGTGPFMVASYDDSQQRARFVRNPNWIFPGLPAIDAVEYRWGVDSNTQLQQLKAGDVSALGDGIPSSLVPVARATPGLSKDTELITQLAVRWIQLNLKKKPFSDVRVRQALNWAINRNQIAKLSYGESTGWGAPFPPNLYDYQRVAKPYTYNRTLAKQLLSEAGYPNGFTTTLYSSTDDPYPKLAQVIQSQLATIGVKVSIKLVSGNALNDLQAKNAVDMSLTHWYFVQPSAADLVNSNYITGASDNYNGYSDPQVDKLAKFAQESFDTSRQNFYYAQIEQLLTQDAPAVFLTSFNYVAGRVPSIQNFHYRGEYGIYYDRMWLA